ncbi:MAG: quinolinate synthase NadA [Lachnospiraceae bacterium]|nr:quinolinate synthase NadA [Lachnospiraceae bacterium]
MQNIVSEIEQLKKEKNAIILAHYYVDDEVQKIADFVGDSYYLSKKALEAKEEVIVFCGVNFMGESAKILNPTKTVIMPDDLADCPMAHMAYLDKIDEVRKQYEDLAVVCYINSTAEVKAASDICVTSSNAVKIVKALKEKNIYFIPDENLGRYVASQVPEKNFIFNDGFCHVHTSITAENVLKAKEQVKDALVLVHPECKQEVVDLADYVGSTLGILNYATASDAKNFIICTEMGISYELKKNNPDKNFYSVGHRQFCPNMKRITLEKVRDCMSNLNNQVELDEELRLKANKALERMVEVAK